MPDPDDVLDALATYLIERPDPVATAPELAEVLDDNRRLVLDALELLEARGDVASKKIGRGRAWWIATPPADPPAEPTRTPEPTIASDDVQDEPPDVPPEVPDDLEDVVRDLDSIPGDGVRYEERVRAVLAVLRELEREDLRASEIRNRVYDEHPAGYTRGEDPRRSWWKNCVSLALSELADEGVVTLVDKHSGTWRKN